MTIHTRATTVALLIVGAIALAGCSGNTAPKPTHTTPATFTAVGDIIVNSSPIDGDGIGVNSDGTCDGMNGYSDIDEGTQVNIYDASGKIVASGNLETGTGDTSQCQFNYSISGIPRGSKFYQIEISHRGKITETAAEMLQPVRLSIGN